MFENDMTNKKVKLGANKSREYTLVKFVPKIATKKYISEISEN